jgi:crotonobetainyl-CoA:carnitine CoA-transferase CaiB-like acyl-CoA transferase
MPGLPEAIRTPAPAVGQHSDEILAEAGYSAGEIEKLRAEAVVS